MDGSDRQRGDRHRNDESALDGGSTVASSRSVLVRDLGENTLYWEVAKAEFETLRAEIARLQDHQRDILNNVVLVVAAMFSVAGAAAGSSDPQVGDVTTFALLLFPWAFSMLACLYADRTVRILACADYLHNYLRLRLREFLDVGRADRVWQWERYKLESDSGRLTRPNGSTRLGRFLDRTRWLIFVGSGLAAVGLFLGITLIGRSADGTLSILFDIPLPYAIGFGLFPLVLIAFLLSPLQETSGVVRREPLTLPVGPPPPPSARRGHLATLERGRPALLPHADAT